MTDYGHDLLLGTFLTPTAHDAARVVDLAVLTERVGLDLVAVQDHPYQPAYLDMWTLLSWTAARTERIRVVPDVANLPLRPPAVLARAAASLDLLSGGRVELGLGAGAYWDAIEAMGGARLTAGQAVDALAEAVDVIRGIWDTTDRRRLVAGGAHHSVQGAKRGPAPAHPVGIWVGGYRPRMLHLVGTRADGWLVTLDRLAAPTDRAAANARIDLGARQAGRSPAQVRRVANISAPPTLAGADTSVPAAPVRQWVDQLTSLVVEHGISGLVLGTDDPGVIAIYGEEVAPALREAVATERSRT